MEQKWGRYEQWGSQSDYTIEASESQNEMLDCTSYHTSRIGKNEEIVV
jgi:hypothetical protein